MLIRSTKRHGSDARTRLGWALVLFCCCSDVVPAAWHIVDIVMGVQYAFNCVAQTVAMAAADFHDEKKVAALQETGALPDTQGRARGSETPTSYKIALCCDCAVTVL